MRIRILIIFDADPDPEFYLMRKRIRSRFFTLKRIQIQILDSKYMKCSNRLLFHAFWLFICKLMRIRIWFRIRPITLMRIRMRIRIFIWYGSESRLPKWCGSGCTTLNRRESTWPGLGVEGVHAEYGEHEAGHALLLDPTEQEVPLLHNLNTTRSLSSQTFRHQLANKILIYWNIPLRDEFQSPVQSML